MHFIVSRWDHDDLFHRWRMETSPTYSHYKQCCNRHHAYISVWSGKYLEGKVSPWRVCTPSTLKDNAKLLFYVVVRIYTPSVIYQSSRCSTSLLIVGITELLDFNHSDKCEMVWISFMLIIGIFLTAGEGGDFFFMYFLLFRGFSFINCLYPLLIFFHWVVAFFLLICISCCLGILILSWLKIWVASISVWLPPLLEC